MTTHKDIFSNEINPNFEFKKFGIGVDEIKNETDKILNNVQKKVNQSEVLDNLLKEIGPIDFRDYFKLPDKENVQQKHIIVGVIKYLLEVAKNRNWNLSKVYDYTYVYNGAYWQQLDKEDMKTFLGKVAIEMGQAECDARHYEFKDKLLKQFLTDAHLPAPPGESNKILINLKNGTFEFTSEGCKIREFIPEDFLTYQLPFEYDPDKTCPLFSNYLNKVLPDLNSQKILQEFSGYIFTKLNLEKMLLLTGGGANGKSVFFNIISSLLGKENILTYSIGLFEHEYNRAKLTNVLLNYSSEKGTEINPDTFKALVSGEPLQAREPYGKSFTLYNKVRFIVNANELPKETEQTEAYFRRYLIIPFDIKIAEHERDPDLADKIIRNELPGVFNWLLEGLHRIVDQKRFTVSEKTDKALANFKKQSDSVALFIDENYFYPSNLNKQALSELYKKYKEFCLDDGYKPVGKNKFSNRLESKGFTRTRLSGGSAAFYIESNPERYNQFDSEEELPF